jgi:spore coat polysaccharide biosynthesis protein SpsF (cytidylyltransferase family)
VSDGPVVAIVQARMGSTRLPGKSLAPIAGRPMLWHVLMRARAARSVDRVVLATTTEDRDTPLSELAAAMAVPVFRGSEDDVLDRYHGAAGAHGAAVIVRLTADNPLQDPGVVDETVALFGRAGVSYASNVHPRTYPKGLDVEVIGRTALDEAWREATEPFDREHVTPYLWKQPARYPQANLAAGQDRSSWRWTVDEPEDLDFVRTVYDRLWHEERGVFDAQAVIALLDSEPALRAHCDRVARTTIG